MMNTGLKTEHGFVLATSLVMLLLMTMLTAVVYFGVNASQKSSASAESATQAFFYAETAVNYMAWALRNDAEFDSYRYPQAVRTDVAAPNDKFFDEPDPIGATGDPYARMPRPLLVGDLTEWLANPGNSSGLDKVAGVAGQLMYFDNAALDNRIISLRNADLYTNNNKGYPDFYQIHTKLPRYISLSIDSDGNITPSMPPYDATLPHHGNVQGVDFPKNGALVWLTGGDPTQDYYTAPIDDYAQPLRYQGFSIDLYNFYDDLDGGVVRDDKYYSCPLVAPGVATIINGRARACDRTSGVWLESSNYGPVIYALGYVNGKARKLIRLVYVPE